MDGSCVSLIPLHICWRKPWPVQADQPEIDKEKPALDVEKSRTITEPTCHGLGSALSVFVGSGFFASVIASWISILTAGSFSMGNLFSSAPTAWGDPI
jgi:hypothetical protein